MKKTPGLTRPLPDKTLFKLVSLRESILWSPQLSYYPSVFCMLSLPTRQVEGTEFVRDSGNGWEMTILSPSKVGIPYGVYARGILAFIARSVTYNAEQELADPQVVKLGTGVTHFLTALNESKNPTGGSRGNLTKIKEQCRSVGRSHIQYSMPGRNGHALLWRNYDFVDSGLEEQEPELWEPERDEKTGQLIIRLGDKFYKDLREHAAPFHSRILPELWPNCLMIDIAMWLAYRSNEIQCGELRLSWTALRDQFGANYTAPGSLRVFKSRFRKAFEVVRSLYDPSDPDAVRLDEVGDVLRLRVRRPMVPQFDRAAYEYATRQERASRKSWPTALQPVTPHLFDMRRIPGYKGHTT